MRTKVKFTIDWYFWQIPNAGVTWIENTLQPLLVNVFDIIYRLGNFIQLKFIVQWIYGQNQINKSSYL